MKDAWWPVRLQETSVLLLENTFLVPRPVSEADITSISQENDLALINIELFQ